MTGLTLNDILSDALLIILYFLHESHRASLCSLTLVTRNLHSIAASFLFRSITIVVQGVHDSNYLHGLISQLSPHILANIRHLSIEGTGKLQKTNRSSNSEVNHYQNQHIYHPIENYFHPAENSIRSTSNSFKTSLFPARSDQDQAWKPLAHLGCMTCVNPP
jgi:hypothetical protein